MDISKIIVARKLSLAEFEMRKFGLDFEGLIKKYKDKNLDPSVLVNSYEAQRKSFDEVKRMLPGVKVFEGRGLKKALFKNTGIVISLGGDNYFQYVSRFLDDQLIIGVNSDPARSEGVLNYFNAEDLEVLIQKLKDGNFNIEEWTRLAVSIDGKKLSTPAISEIYLGSEERFTISKYKIFYRKKEEEQKSSGILIATGAGSTGWYNSAKSCGNANKNFTFPKELKEGRFFVTEAFRGKIHFPTILEGIITQRIKLEVVNFGKGKSVVSIDSKLNFDFPYGSRVLIEVSKSPLRVVRFK